MVDSFQMTADGYAALKQELEQLKEVDRKEVVERIRIAREWGDLKENAEYHDAKNTQGLLEHKIRTLEERLKHAEIVEASSESVAVGSKVEVEDESGKKLTFSLVSSAEADPSAGKLSADSPIGSALIGGAPGETVEAETPGGGRKFKIVSIEIA